MSKQWDGFNSDWLNSRVGKEATDIEKAGLLDLEIQINCAVAKGIHARNEEELHMAIVEYIRLKHPDHFPWCHSDMSGFRVGIKARVKLGTMKHSRGFPDLVIYTQGWCQESTICRVKTRGLALEIKHQDARPKPYLKDGSLSRDIHIQEQASWLGQFESLGFMSYFVVGFEAARHKIDAYTGPGLPADTRVIGK